MVILLGIMLVVHMVMVIVVRLDKTEPARELSQLLSGFAMFCSFLALLAAESVSVLTGLGAAAALALTNTAFALPFAVNTALVLRAYKRREDVFLWSMPFHSATVFLAAGNFLLVVMRRLLSSDNMHGEKMELAIIVLMTLVYFIVLAVSIRRRKSRDENEVMGKG